MSFVMTNDQNEYIAVLLLGRISVWRSGMRLKYVTIDGLSICYGEKGQIRKDSVSMLLVHGFSADKFMWVPLVNVSRVITKGIVCGVSIPVLMPLWLHADKIKRQKSL